MERIGTAATEYLDWLRPTEKQLGYLRHLAKKQRSTFVWPSTRVEAAEEIQRLLGERNARASRRRRKRSQR